MEDGLFPHQRSMNDADGLEEERRLCYVGTTRAMSELYLTCAEQRRMYGIDKFSHPSRFISEIPEDLIEEVRPNDPDLTAGQSCRSAQSLNRVTGGTRKPGGLGEAADNGDIRLGQHVVRHGKFGEGVVLNYEGTGAHARVQVNFETAGTKWLVMSYAKLELM